MSKFTELVREQSTINVIGLLVILGVGIGAGVAFTAGEWQAGLLILLGGGFAGMILAWIRKPGEKK